VRRALQLGSDRLPITVTVISILIFMLKLGGMAEVPFPAPAPPLRDGPHITVEPPLTVTSPQLDCDQSLYFFRFSEGKTRARVENAFSHTRDHFLVSRVSLDRLRKKETARSLLHNGHLSAMATLFVPADK